MPQIGNSIHGVNLTAIVTKDFSTGRPGTVGRGERVPFARGSAKFSKSSLDRIKIGTVGRPDARASRITEKSVKTASRAVGEGLGALRKGDLDKVSEWMGQARKNLEPMVKRSLLGSAAEFQAAQPTSREVSDHVLTLRLTKHLESLDTETLTKMANQLKKSPENDLSGCRHLMETAFKSVLQQRSNTEVTSLVRDLPAHVGDKAWVSQHFQAGVQKLAETHIALKELKGEPVQQTGMAATIRAALFHKLSTEDQQALAGSLPNDALTSLAGKAIEPGLGVIKDEIRNRADKVLETAMKSMAKFQHVDGQEAEKCLQDASVAMDELMQFTRNADLAVPGMNLKSFMRAGAQGLMEGVYKGLGQEPGFVKGLRTDQLESLLALGESVELDFGALQGPAKAFLSQVRDIGESRFKDEYHQLKATGQSVARELAKSPLQLGKLNDLYKDFSGKCVDMYAHNRLVDRSLQSNKDGGMSLADYPARILDHMMHANQTDGVAQGKDFLEPTRTGPSILKLDFRGTDLSSKVEELREAPLGDLNRLRQELSERYQKDKSAQTVKQNLELVDTVLRERKAESVATYLGNHATEAAWAIQIGGVNARGLSTQFFLGYLAIQGIASVSETFVPMDRQNRATHTVSLPPDLAYLESHYNQIHAQVLQTSQARQFIPVDEVIKASPHVQAFMQQIGT